MLVKSFASNIIIDISYNLSKHTQYKHVWNIFEVICLHQHTVITFYRLDGNNSGWKFLRILVTNVYFTDRNRIPKTVYYRSSHSQIFYKIF